MTFWLSATQVAGKMDRLRAAESKLIALSKLYQPSAAGPTTSTPDIFVCDTPIPRSVVPIKDCVLRCSTNQELKDNEHYVIHSVEVKSRTNSKNLNLNSKSPSTSTPLVLLHGYMNGGVYFYRNFLSLSRFFDSIHSLDLLGWGLSSRPSFKQIQSTSAAESFFVESLEAWRKAQKIDKMILAGHSMGGYLSVAYCERYPERVERLILLSPVGVPKEDEEMVRKRQIIREQTWPWRARVVYSIYHGLFNFITVGDLLRSVSSARAKSIVSEYSSRRLGFSTRDELDAFVEYLYENNTLPASGIDCVNRILNPSVMAKEPLEDRIPKLQGVKSISFLYGAQDWMDVSGGLKVQEAIRQQQTTGQETLQSSNYSSSPMPHVDVYRVNDAGHLLMLEQPETVSAGIILSSVDPVNQPKLAQALSLPSSLLPHKISLAQYQQEQESAAMAQKEFQAQLQKQQEERRRRQTLEQSPAQ